MLSITNLIAKIVELPNNAKLLFQNNRDEREQVALLQVSTPF